MGFQRYQDYGAAEFLHLLDSQHPYSLRIRGAIAEMKDEASIWVDNPLEPRLTIHRARGWLNPIGEENDILSFLGDLESMAKEMEEEGEEPYHPSTLEERGVLRLSALPVSVRNKVANEREMVRQTGCGLYTLEREEFIPYREGPPLDRIRENEYELVANLAQHGERAPYVSERVAKAPHVAVRLDGELASYMIVHANGSIGMLHTVEKFRNRKLGRYVASALVEKQFQRNMPVYCYILDGNTPSQRLFASLGFHRAAEVSWCVFRRQEG